MTIRRKLLLALLVPLLLLGTAGYWLIATESGLRFIWSRARALAPVPLAGEVRGQLIGPLRVEGLALELRRARVEAASADLDWDPLGLLKGRLAFTRVRVNELTVTVKPRAAGEAAAPPRIPASPILLDVNGAVQGLTVRWGAGRQLRFAQASINGVAGPFRLHARSFTLDGYGAHLEASGDVGLRLDGAVDLATRWFYQPPRGEQVRGHGKITGTLSHPRTEQIFDAVLRGGASGALVWIDRPVSWEAELRTRPVESARLHRPWHPLEIGGRLHAVGAGAELRWEAQGTLRESRTGLWDFEAAGEREAAGWRLPQLRLAAREGPARISASGKLLTGDGAAVALDLEWSGLAWPPAGDAPQVQSPQGRVTVQGRLDRYVIAGRAALARPGLPDGEVELEGEGDRDGIALSRLRARWLEGELLGTGRLRWRPLLSWNLELEARDINPGRWQAGWEGRVDGRIQSQGERRQGKLQVRLAVDRLGGQLRGRPLAGQARLLAEPGRLRIEELDLQSGEARLQAQGEWGARWDLRWALRAARIEDLVPGLSGALQGEGRLEGTRALPRVRAEMTGENLAWQERRAARLELHADLDLAGEHPWDLRLQGRGLEPGRGLVVDQLSLSGQGSTADHRVRLDARTEGRSLQAEAQGGYQAGRWQGWLLSSQLSDPALGTWAQQEAAALTLSADRLRLEQSCWGREEARLCLALAGNGRQGWRGDAQLKGLPLAVLQPLLEKDFRLRGTLAGRGSFRYHEGLQSLDLDLLARDGDFRFRVSEREVINTPYRRLNLRVHGGKAGFEASAGLQLANGDHARAQLALPRWRPGDPFDPEQPLRGSAEASLGELVWVSLLVPDLVATGRLESSFTVRGTLGRPLLQGNAALAGGRLAVPLLGISLADLRIEARPEGEQMLVHAAARSGPGVLELDGRFTTDAQGWRLLLDARGTEVEVARLPQAHVMATPDLHADIRRGVIRLRGSLLIPRAEIDLGEIEAPVQASPDIVLVDSPRGAAARAPRWKVISELVVRFGDQVRLTGYGFSGRLGGQIVVVEPEDGGAVGRGALEILDGKYEAYGQELTIEEGRLLYGNAPLNNPGIEFRAVRRVDEVTVGILATGRLKKPEVRLYSEPAMDDTAVLSYLVLGRPLETASEEEADVLQQAALGLGVAGGTEVARRIASEVGVDVVNVQGGTEKSEAALVLGKYLSPRLYVQYAVGLWEAANTWQMRYRLDENWSVEAESGLQSGVDILYTIEK